MGGNNCWRCDKNTSSQVAWSGFVQVDNIKSIGLSLPNECDDFEIITDFLDLDFVLKNYGFISLNIWGA